MESSTPTETMKERVLAKVQSGEVRMKPRSYFAVRFAASVLLSLVVFVLTIFIASFVFFSVNEAGDTFLLNFGLQGIVTFLALFPWSLILANILCIFALEALLRRFSFVYRISLLRIFGAIIAASVFIGWAIIFTPLHTAILNETDHASVPVLSQVYETIRGSRVHYGIFRGVVVEIGETYFIMAHDDLDRDADDGVRTVHLSKETFTPAVLHVGDKVYVAGSAKGTDVQAYGVQVFSTDTTSTK